jgi:hypothetical protein
VLALPLPAAGITHDIAVPPGFAGALLRAQPITLTTQAANGVYATGGAHDLQLR